MYIQNVTHTLKPTRSATLHIPTLAVIQEGRPIVRQEHRL